MARKLTLVRAHLPVFPLCAYIPQQETPSQGAVCPHVSHSGRTKIEASNCDKPFSLEVLFEIADALEMSVNKFLDDI